MYIFSENFKYGLTVGLVFTFSILLFSCNSSPENLNNANNLKLSFFFGSDGEVLLAGPWQIATDDRKSVFISDMMANRIYEYSYKGEFQRSYGREGRGPGEFQIPTVLEANSKWIYVQDPMSSRLVLFNHQNDSTKVIIQKNFGEFALSNGKIYAFAPATSSFKPPPSDKNLIGVYNSQDGRLVSDFGEYLNLAEDLPSMMSRPYIEIEDTVVHVAFQYFPFYRAYSTEGELLFDLDLSQIVSDLPNLIQKNKNVQREGDRMESTAVFKSMDTYDNRIFILRQAPKIVIDEYSFMADTLIHRKTYLYENAQSKDVEILDFFYHPPNNSFYILEMGRSNPPAVRVYETIENS